MKKILIALVIATALAIIGSPAHAKDGPRTVCSQGVSPVVCIHDNYEPINVLCAPRPTPAYCIGHVTHRPRVIRVEWADHRVSHRRVVDVDEVDSVGTGRYLVWFNNGSAFYMHGCVYEDGHRCVWNAHKRGNRVGHSFVQLHRHWYYY